MGQTLLGVGRVLCMGDRHTHSNPVPSKGDGIASARKEEKGAL